MGNYGAEAWLREGTIEPQYVRAGRRHVPLAAAPSYQPGYRHICSDCPPQHSNTTRTTSMAVGIFGRRYRDAASRAVRFGGSARERRDRRSDADRGRLHRHSLSAGHLHGQRRADKGIGFGAPTSWRGWCNSAGFLAMSRQGRLVTYEDLFRVGGSSGFILLRRSPSGKLRPMTSIVQGHRRRLRLGSAVTKRESVPANLRHRAQHRARATAPEAAPQSP